MRAPLGGLLTSLNIARERRRKWGREEEKGGGEKRGGGRTGKRRMTMRSRKWRWIRMRPEKEDEG